MRHIHRISRHAGPARASSLLEWAQKGQILSTFAGAINTLVVALGNYTEIEKGE